jgi:hypothetical protein
MLRSSGCTGLMSGSAHWLTSWASGQGAPSEQEVPLRGGHVSAPDPHSYDGVSQVSEPCQGPVPTLRDLGPTRGTRYALLRAPVPLVQRSDALLRRSGPIDASWGVLSPLATRCSQPCPCGGVRCCFSCDRGGVARQWRLYTVGRGYP